MSDSIKPNIKGDHDALLAFVLEKSQEAPLDRRIQVLRGLQQIIGEPQAVANLTEVIALLSNADRLARQFRFDFENPKPKTK